MTPPQKTGEPYTGVTSSTFARLNRLNASIIKSSVLPSVRWKVRPIRKSQVRSGSPKEVFLGTTVSQRSAVTQPLAPVAPEKNGAPPTRSVLLDAKSFKVLPPVKMVNGRPVCTVTMLLNWKFRYHPVVGASIVKFVTKRCRRSWLELLRSAL